MPSLRKLTSSVLIVSLLAGLILGPLQQVVEADVSTNATTNKEIQGTTEIGQGLVFRLSTGSDQPERNPTTGAASTELSQSDVDNILKRLPPIKVDSNASQQFVTRDASLPAPRTGETITTPFPSSVNASREEVPDGPLEILRYSPEGSIPLAPELSITFSHPMIVLSSQEESATEVPVKLSPQPPGKWRWLGTKTLIFKPDGKFPMATTYVVSVPAGTRAVNGSTLATEKSWSFTTPSPAVKSSYPTGGSIEACDALMFIEFDQRVSPTELLRAIRVKAGQRELKTRLATDEEVKQLISKDSEGTKVLREVPKERWLAFRAVDPKTGKSDLALPADSQIDVTLVSGAPSAEGPNLTTKQYDFTFRTYGQLRVAKYSCDGESNCGPSDSFDIEFNNPLPDEIDPAKVRVEPALDQMQLNSYGSSLFIEGTLRGNTTYRVTLDKSFTDEFNQTLGKNVKVEFKVGPSGRKFAGPDNSMVVMDPAAPTRCSVFSINYTKLDVRLYSVNPADWPQWIAYQRNYRQTESAKRTPIPGKLVHSQTISVKFVPNDIVETIIDLSPALNNGHGQMIMTVKPYGGTPTDDDYSYDYLDESWIQVTDIGLDAFLDQTDLVGWVTALKDGSPLGGVEVSLLPSNLSSRSGADGLARFALTTQSSDADVIVAKRGDDVALLPREVNYWGSGRTFSRKEQKDSLRWFVFDDRKMYQPGEEVHVKGWIRKIGAGKSGDVGLVSDELSEIAYTLNDSRGLKLKSGTLMVNALGGFDWSFPLPKNANLGTTTLTLQTSSPLAEHTYRHSFQVQEYRRPEFEVRATTQSEGPYFVGTSADVALKAAYYAGGGLPNAPVKWSVVARQAELTPPNHHDYVWNGEGYYSGSYKYLDGVTDNSGTHRLHIDFDSVKPASPMILTASASVTDVNRQVWNSETTLLVHPADLYVGLKSDKTFVRKNEPIEVQSIVSDLDGKLVSGREIKMTGTRLSWQHKDDEWVEIENDKEECVIRSSAEAVKCRFQPKAPGEYRVRATVLDDRDRPNESELSLWVSGGPQLPRPDLEADDADLIPDQKEYKVGDTANILVNAPFFPAEGLLTLQRFGIVKVERFSMDGPTRILQIPIEPGSYPKTLVQIDLVGAVERPSVGSKTNLRRPASASGFVWLNIPPLDRRLSVTATPRDKGLKPGGETSVAIEVKDANGAPVSEGEVAVVVVDEAVLALTNYKLDDPISIFYPERRAEVDDVHLRENLLLATTKALLDESERTPNTLSAMATDARTVLGGSALPAPPNQTPTVSIGGDEAATFIHARENLNALAVFAPSVPTDANGHAEVSVKLPENLTRYRVMAVAVAGGKQFGSAESSITARLPLMVRASAPRFLNFGDTFEFPIVVQNQTDKPMPVDVVLRASNARLTSSAGRRVNVPANDRVEVRIPVSTANAGTARFQVAATSSTWSDAAEVSLPVWTPATTESFATYGEIDQGAISQSVKAPSEVFDQFGGLEIEASSTQLQQLTDAFLYLQNYPYECSEQLASRIMSVAALNDLLTAFKAKDLPTKAEMEAAVARDLNRLSSMQNDDGGFGFWQRGDESWPFLSIHVAHALVRAQQKRLPINVVTYYRVQEYLRNIESHIPANYSQETKLALKAYALYVRALMGDRDSGAARKMLAESSVDSLPLEAIGWLLPVLSGDAGLRPEVEQLRNTLKNRVTETASTANFAYSYHDEDYLVLNSSRRADAVILETLIGDQPGNDLIPKIVRGLLDHRVQGRWDSTQENVFVLLALERYFRTYEKVTPNFVARVWLGDVYAGEQEFRGRTTDRKQINVPMSYLNGVKRDLVLDKQGSGRLYYRLAMNYAPLSLKLKSADYGFAVERTYEAVDNAEDVRHEIDGTWVIKAGSRVRVRVSMATPSRRYHVALVDPLPAGLETLNPDLAVTEQIPEDKKQEALVSYGSRSLGNNWSLWRSVWFDHQNLRNDRSEAFTTLLWEGVYNYSYVARATTPGTFVVPPSKAEEMYHPETFGRSKTDRVRIE